MDSGSQSLSCVHGDLCIVRRRDRPAISTSAPVRRTTRQVCTAGHCASALIGIASFSGMRLPPRTSLVRGDQRAGSLRVLDAIFQGLRGEAAEDHRMNGADARTGQHGVSRLGNHRHVDAHPVAALDAARAQRVGQAADCLVQLGVGNVLAVGGVIPFPDQRRLSLRGPAGGDRYS